MTTIGIYAAEEGSVPDLPWETAVYRDVPTYLAALREKKHRCAILYRLERGQKGALLAKTRTIAPGLPVIVADERGFTGDAIDVMKGGAFDYVAGAGMKHRLALRVKAALAEEEEKNTTDRTRVITFAAEETTLEQVFWNSAEMFEIWKMVGRIAHDDATVLIQGESGTGKEILARAIVRHSNRQDGPFMTINCASIPEKLLESELFGHEQGAFTGAHARRIGKFELCDGGTVLLDGVDDLSLMNQSKLLRFLEDQSFQRVGGNESISTNVRIVAATSRSLVQMVREGSFRLDLFYRLKVVSFHLPPLRERKDDIPGLAEYFIKEANKRHRRSVTSITGDALDFLREARWVGNVREFKNVLDAAVVLCRKDVLELSDILPMLHDTDAMSGMGLADGATGCEHIFQSIVDAHYDTLSTQHRGKLHQALAADLEKALLTVTMRRLDNNQVQAATVLGISRNTLRERLGRYGLQGVATP